LILVWLRIRSSYSARNSREFRKPIGKHQSEGVTQPWPAAKHQSEGATEPRTTGKQQSEGVTGSWLAAKNQSEGVTEPSPIGNQQSEGVTKPWPIEKHQSEDVTEPRSSRQHKSGKRILFSKTPLYYLWFLCIPKAFLVDSWWFQFLKFCRGIRSIATTDHSQISPCKFQFRNSWESVEIASNSGNSVPFLIDS
jgi:hypothetical protein